jgi:NAD(P)-dependent dehydrogenase (short-subunit alcohol dehydrogenase family)
MNDSTPLAVVTGANSGVGFHTTRELVEEGWHVVMVCRSRERGEAAKAKIEEEFEEARVELALHDLAHLDDVAALADDLSRRGRIDALVNNAGLYRASLDRTPDGFETTMGVNHVAHQLLTLRLADSLRRPGVRIVNVASEGHRSARLRRAPLADILRGRQPKYGGVQAYADSKLANVLFTRELVRRWGDDGVVALSLHPGVLSTRIWDNTKSFLRILSFAIRPFMDTPEVGGKATAACVTDEGLAEDNGAYLKKFKVVDAAPEAGDAELAEELWEVTVRELGDRL